MNKIDFSNTLETRIIAMEAEKELLEEEMIICNEFIKRYESDKDLSSRKLVIENKKRVIEIRNAVVSKNDFLQKLKANIPRDEAEFQKDLDKANKLTGKILEACNNFVNEQEAHNNGSTGAIGAQVQFMGNMLIDATTTKDWRAKVFYFNALNKQLKELGIKIDSGLHIA